MIHLNLNSHGLDTAPLQEQGSTCAWKCLNGLALGLVIIPFSLPTLEEPHQEMSRTALSYTQSISAPMQKKKPIVLVIESTDSDDELADFVPTARPKPALAPAPMLPKYTGAIKIKLDLVSSDSESGDEESSSSSFSSSSVPATPLPSPRSVPSTPGRDLIEEDEDDISHSAATVGFSQEPSQAPYYPGEMPGDDNVFLEPEPHPIVPTYDPEANEIVDSTQDIINWFNAMPTTAPISPIKPTAPGTFNKSFFEEVLLAATAPDTLPLPLLPAVRTFTPGVSYFDRAPAPAPLLFEESIPDPMDIVIPAVPLTPPEATQPTQVFEELLALPLKVARTEAEEAEKPRGEPLDTDTKRKKRQPAPRIAEPRKSSRATQGKPVDRLGFKH